MKTLQIPLIMITFFSCYLFTYSKNEFPQFLFAEEDIQVYIGMVNDIRAQHGLHPYKYKKDAENASKDRIRTIYKKIEHKTYEEVRDSAYEWMHFGMYYDLLSYNVTLEMKKKDYSMIGPGEIVAGYLFVNKILVRDSLFREVLTGWLNSPPHRVKLLSDDDDTCAVSFANFGEKKGVFACMVIFSEFRVKKGKKTK